MKVKNDYELNKEVQYWAGRLIGHEQNYEIAQEIVDAINNAEEVVKNLAIHDVSNSFYCYDRDALGNDHCNKQCKKCEYENKG